MDFADELKQVQSGFPVAASGKSSPSIFWATEMPSLARWARCLTCRDAPTTCFRRGIFPALCGQGSGVCWSSHCGIVRPATDFQGVGYSRENAIGIETAACPQIVLIARHAFCAALRQAERQ